MTEIVSQEATDSRALPEGWALTTLRDIVEQMSNGLTKRQSKEPVGVPVSRIQTISKGTVDLDLVGYLPDVSIQEVEKYKLRQGDILFSHINSDLHLGKTALFTLDNTLLLHGMNLLLIRVDDRLVLPELLHYLFNHLRFSGYFMSVAQHAVNQSSINQSKMKATPIPLPPLNEQRRIVGKIEELFTKLDAGVRSLEQTRVLLKSYRRSVLKAAVEGELSREWREAHRDELEPASELLDRILQERREKFAGKKYKEPASPDTSELPALPKGWEWTSADQLTTVITDGEHITPERSENGVPLLSARNVQDGWLSFEKIDHVPESVYEILTRRLLVRPGDVLMSCSGTVGRSCVAPRNSKFALVRSVAVLKPLTDMGAYLSYALRSPLLQQQIHKKKTQTAQANIFQGKIRTLVFPLPPLEEQRFIVEDIERRLSVVDKLEATVEENLKQAAGLRQSILKRAFSGKLVPQDPDDEPAGVLLARIREEREAAKQKARKPRKFREDDEAQGRLI